jgi:hypothetical protein
LHVTFEVFQPSLAQRPFVTLDGISHGSSQTAAAHLRLGQIVLGPLLNRLEREAVFRVPAEDDDWQVRSVSRQSVIRLNTATVRQPEVEQNAVEWFAAGGSLIDGIE